MLKKQVEEEHGEVYGFLLKRYLTGCKAFKTYCTKPPMKPPKLVAIPGHRWFMKVGCLFNCKIDPLFLYESHFC